ncbi:Nramp family divalent metal transporter [Heliophilum fasciatum]|uniref:Nramp family divalent metal transporter n=1 Tax=Heliophilum fasciatum TaxID=35700 RepID=UPI0022262D48|nr:Nramp family divalent metal transporter [Heliophilum fasciatum]
MYIESYHRSQFGQRARQMLRYLGPAFIVSVAYIDPGNFATNISGGSKFNYALLWVILWSNAMAIFLQTISAKLGIATGSNLPEMCAKVFSRRTNWCLWIVAEVAAMATDLAEFLGGALGLYLLLQIPLPWAGLIIGVLTLLIIYMEKYGQRTVEMIIGLLVAVICGAYTLELFLAKPNWSQVSYHTLVPSLPNGEALLIAVGMLGATVMPHVIYLHSQLVQSRKTPETEEQKKRHFHLTRWDIIIAMNIAFIVNAAMVVVAGSVFFTHAVEVETIEQAHQSLAPLLGSLSSAVFAIALLASGLSSSAVGTMAGQTIMKGFVNLQIPLLVRRLITMVPAMVVIMCGIDPMKALVISQVVLSFSLPAAVIPLLMITRRREIMGSLVNSPWTNRLGYLITSIIIGLNAVLIILTFTGQV